MSVTWFILIHKPGCQQGWLSLDSYNMCILTCCSTSWYRTCNTVVTGACWILWDNKARIYFIFSLWNEQNLQILIFWSLYCATSAYRFRGFSWILCNKNPLVNAVWIMELVTREPLMFCYAYPVNLGVNILVLFGSHCTLFRLGYILRKILGKEWNA